VISFPDAGLPLSVKELAFELAVKLRRMMRFDFPGGPLSSISIHPFSFPILRKLLISVARPKTYRNECERGDGHWGGKEIHTAGGKLSPRQRAQAILLFPVPLGPTTMLRYGPGLKVAKS